ncbi:hypothetical protein OIU77_008194 [Salix suchowensis]|uniref:Uncharacterized protein n=1 Tax=Salix suchowensis TaxID=1278906 RepID=A0ABQ9AJJ4_9ROSI|nr:hypothetical protein OIU77_008194 [Salix suchowensis]
MIRGHHYRPRPTVNQRSNMLFGDSILFQNVDTRFQESIGCMIENGRVSFRSSNCLVIRLKQIA